MLIAELQRRGVIKMVVDSLPDQSWKWGMENPRFTNGNWNVSGRILIYRDFPPNRGASIRTLEVVSVVLDPSKVLTVSGQITIFSGPIPEDQSTLGGIVSSSIGEAYFNPERRLVHINLIGSLLHNPKPTL